VLEIKGLSKTFPGQKALIDVDFAVDAGSVHALVGQNGSGKSTLIKCLAGYHTPDPGAQATVWKGGEVDPRPVQFRLGDARAADDSGVRFVHQDLGLVENLGAAENLALGTGYRTSYGAINWRVQNRVAADALRELGYEFDVRTPVGELTPAERTGLAIARALHDWEANVDLLVLDEPTAALPGADVERLFEVIKTVSARGVAVVYVSHHLDEVFEIADVVTILRDGRKVATRPTGELDHHALIQLIVGSAVDVGSAAALADEVQERPVVLSTRGLGGQTLASVDFDVHEGEVLGIAGITGSGREVVARLLFGALGRSGSVDLAGTALPNQRPDVAMEAGMAFVPADRKQTAIIPEMTVRENITITRLSDYFSQLFLARRPERADVREWMDRLDVRPRAPEREIKNLSGGNQQKAVLAKWLRLDPKVLVLDEPTQGVDVGAKADIHRLIDHAAAEGTGVVVCSTDTEELVRVCSRVIVLLRGRELTQLVGSDISVERIEALQLQTTQEATA
jgi:ribose transport system ATP-binding protein